MDWSGLLGDSWRMMRRAPALWGLGTFSALQAATYSLIVSGLMVPAIVLTQLLAQFAAAQGSGLSAMAGIDVAGLLPPAVAWLEHWAPQLIAGITLLVAAWAVLGVLDVAATAGSISQTTELAEHHAASVRAGMRDGFAIWWRTVGLLAFAALPSLVYLLAVAVFTLFAVTIPLLAGGLPDPAALQVGNALNTALSLVAGVLGIPLTVLVQLGLRYAVVEHQEWRPALASAWRLARANLAEVALMYLLQAGVVVAVSIAFMAVAALFGASAAVAAAGLATGSQSLGGAAVAVAVLGAAGIIALGMLLTTGVFVWISVAWTLFWRRLTGREPGTSEPAVTPDIYAAPGVGYAQSEAPGSAGQPVPPWGTLPDA